MTPKYYSLSDFVSRKENGTGDNPQAVIKEKKFTDKENLARLECIGSRDYKLKNRGKIPDFDFYLEYVELYAKAKLTDFISYGSQLSLCSLIVSDRALGFLLELDLPIYKIYPVHLYQKGIKIEGYQLFVWEPIDEKDINYNKSIFYINESFVRFPNQREYEEISTYEEFIKWIEKRGPLSTHAEKISLDRNRFLAHDLVYIWAIDGVYRVSETFTTRYEELGLTGLSLDDINLKYYAYICFE